MPIHHDKERERFTRVNNLIIEGDLSSDALALMVYLLSKPTTWAFQSGNIQKRFRWGKNKVCRITKELRENGHMSYTKSCDGPTVWDISETPDKEPYPQNGDEATKPHTQNRDKEPPQPNPQKPDMAIGDVLVTTESPATTEKPLLEIPDFVDGDLWLDFIANRKSLKKPATEIAVKRIITRMNKFHDKGIDVNECLTLSIENGWAGIFEPKGKQNGYQKDNTGRFQPDSAVARSARAAERTRARLQKEFETSHEHDEVLGAND